MAHIGFVGDVVEKGGASGGLGGYALLKSFVEGRNAGMHILLEFQPCQQMTVTDPQEWKLKLPRLKIHSVANESHTALRKLSAMMLEAKCQ